jgi:hypothetical protein
MVFNVRKENTMDKRKMKDERVTVSLWDLDGSLEHAREHIDYLIEQYGKDARLDNDSEYDYDGSCTSVFYLHYKRVETDAEMNKRLKAAVKAREYRKVQKVKDAVKQEANERKELARLQKKYEA